MTIRLADEGDLPSLMSISETADSAAHWTEQQWLDIFRTQTPARTAWIAEESLAGTGVRVTGFAIAQSCGPEWELENIAVLPEFRRRGVGLELLTTLLTYARSLRAEQVLLEVRASNQPAVCLYSANGFQVFARRRDYYRNPTEDALIMVHPL